MKKVVLVNQSTGYLMIDIVNAFAAKYDEVHLIAGSIKVMQRKLSTNVRVTNIIAYNRKSSFSRMYSWLAGTIQVFLLLLFKYHKYELIFVTNPPFAYLSALCFNRKFSVIVYDTYPDALKNIGVRSTSLLFRGWAVLNKKVFGNAKQVFTLSESMAKQLSQYVNSKQLIIIPNWAGSESFRPVQKFQNTFAIKQGLVDKFVILYSGNIGYTHNVEVLVDVAKLLRSYQDIVFMFIGEGKKKQDLIENVKQQNLQNCKFLTWQDSSILPQTLASADLGVVTLNEESGMLSVPSKTYNLLACGVPLLSIAPENSELSQLISNYNNGKNFNYNQVNEISEFILQCWNNSGLLAQLSEGSLNASKQFSYKNAELYVVE